VREAITSISTAVLLLTVVAVGVILYISLTQWTPTIAWFGKNTSIGALYIYADYSARTGDDDYLLFWVGNNGPNPITIDNVYVNSVSYKDRGFKAFVIKEKNVRVSDLSQKYVHVAASFSKDAYAALTSTSPGHDYLLQGINLCNDNSILPLTGWNRKLNFCLFAYTHLLNNPLAPGNYSVTIRFRISKYAYSIYDLQDPSDAANISPTPFFIAVHGKYYKRTTIPPQTYWYVDYVWIYYDVKTQK